MSKPHRTTAQCPSPAKANTPPILAKNPWKTETKTFHTKTRVSLEYIVNDCRYYLNLKHLISLNKPASHKPNSKQEDFNSAFNSNSNFVELRCAVAIITTPSLHENCPYLERFWSVRIFPHSDWIRRESVFSTNAGNYGPRKALNADTFHAVHNDN